jgi:hypothetical protein
MLNTARHYERMEGKWCGKRSNPVTFSRVLGSIDVLTPMGLRRYARNDISFPSSLEFYAWKKIHHHR